MARMKFDFKNVVVILFIAVVLLWLFGQFFSVGGGTIAVADPFPDVSNVGLQILKFLVVGLIVYVAVAIFGKFTGTTVSRKDIFIIVLMAVAVILFWNYIASPIMNANSLDNIVFKFGLKTGLLK